MKPEQWQYLDPQGLLEYDALMKNYIHDNDKVLYNDTATWDSMPDLVGRVGYVYVYSDWGVSPDGRNIAGFKIGDGETKLKDLLFTAQMFDDHVHNTIIHITQAEREYWNNKVTCDYSTDSEKLIFSK